MKRTVFLLITFFCTTITFSQTLNTVVTDAKGNQKLLGQVNKRGLTQEPFKAWFDKNQGTYLENDKVIKALKPDLKDYTIKAFFGSWCGDSKRELPRLYKILEEANYPMNQLEVIAVDRTKEMYKKAPNGEEKGLNIHKVPTFIFYKDGKEVNRIVESPVETLERDIQKIVSSKRYLPNYASVEFVNKLIVEKGLDSLKLMEKELLPQIARYVKGSRDLNGYGYVKLRDRAYDEALYVFDLNTKLFPHVSNTYDSLGEAYFETNNPKEALKNYYKVLSMSPENKTAKVMIAKIEKSAN